ncbi:MAG: Nif3-like dinuclear metal center hexameric protein [Pseudomonadota bacterium]|nr:Nif3-like dinuclear metal center hexameric protein [Pseudomonadota bacterium]
MNITRRSLLMAGAALAASATGRAASTSAGTLTVSQVIERIKNKVGIPWRTETVDNIVAGRADVRVRGIATTMMATFDVLQRAAAANRNLVITHEPTFYSHQDAPDAFRDDATYKEKQAFIAAHDMAVFRFHDHWHRMTPDGIQSGMMRELGWEKSLVSAEKWRYEFPATSLQQFAATMKQRLEVRSMRVLGDPKLQVRHVATRWGYASLLPDLLALMAAPDLDLLIVGETREWELVEYVQDQISAGRGKALIVLNHIVSEQAGMKYCAEWLKPFIREVPVEFIAAQEPFWVA